MNIKVANTKDILSNAILISYIFDSLISTMQQLIIIAIIVSFIFKFNVVFAPCCASLILEGVLIGT